MSSKAKATSTTAVTEESTTSTETTTAVETEVKAESTTKATTTKTVKAKKINVHRYLEQRDFNTYIEALMKSLYPMEFHTVEEWDEIEKKLMSEKIK